LAHFWRPASTLFEIEAVLLHAHFHVDLYYSILYLAMCSALAERQGYTSSAFEKCVLAFIVVASTLQVFIK
jgi:hypothetical protein